ncbi:MAG: heparan N-sulfatase, partial [Bacteroidetes bacterium]
GQPFSFWYGALEPHRGYGGGVGVGAGLSPDSVEVPGFLPEVSPQLRRELCDYYYEVEWADAQLARMLDLLEARGELENTIVIFTADNGMPYPRAKADVYEHGVHIPLAVRWGDHALIEKIVVER